MDNSKFYPFLILTFLFINILYVQIPILNDGYYAAVGFVFY